MPFHRHRIKFPQADRELPSTKEGFFCLQEDDSEHKLHLNDYDGIYSRSGLYEQLFCERLKYSAPWTLGARLKHTINDNGYIAPELRVLDLGAGNGMMGEVLRNYGVSWLVGVDIIEEASAAAKRDRPGIYDEYYVADLSKTETTVHDRLIGWSFNCLTSVGALGLDEIPFATFFEALNLVQDRGWVAFNINESFLGNSQSSRFSQFIRELIFFKYLDLHHAERYLHRLSIGGDPLYCLGIIARKSASIPRIFIDAR